MRLSLAKEILLKVSESNQITVTHDNFDRLLGNVASGAGKFYLGGNVLRLTIIDSKTVKKFASKGYEVIKKDKDGVGFSMMSGKNRVYIFRGGLIYFEG